MHTEVGAARWVGGCAGITALTRWSFSSEVALLFLSSSKTNSSVNSWRTAAGKERHVCTYVSAVPYTPDCNRRLHTVLRPHSKLRTYTMHTYIYLHVQHTCAVLTYVCTVCEASHIKTHDSTYVRTHMITPSKVSPPFLVCPRMCWQHLCASFSNASCSTLLLLSSDLVALCASDICARENNIVLQHYK